MHFVPGPECGSALPSPPDPSTQVIATFRFGPAGANRTRDPAVDRPSGTFAGVICDPTHKMQQVQLAVHKLSILLCQESSARANLAHYATLGWH
ncbi:hypothetical protein GCM10010523_20780 [Paenarthrobacter ilicis]